MATVNFSVPDEVKESRWKRFMERQQAISARLLKQKIGQRIQVIVDEPGGGTSGGAAKGPESSGLSETITRFQKPATARSGWPRTRA